MYKIILILALLVGFAQADEYQKDNRGVLVKTKEEGNNVYVKENGVLRILENNDKFTAANVEEKLYETYKQAKRIEAKFANMTYRLSQLESDKLQREHKKALYKISKYKELITLRGKMEVGAFTALVGIVTSGGVYVVESGMMYSAPLVGAVIFTAGAIYFSYNAVQYIITKAEVR